ncbi:MAG: hypothetical protein Q8O56_06255 [Solirubrobacteraceae bacterium]|nr:hypothetical protein [Solirubrobacteraceae bacterium]
MPVPVETRANMRAQTRLQAWIALGMRHAWRSLRGYDEDDAGEFVALAVLLVLAAQRQSVMLVDAYIALLLRQRAIGLNPDRIIGGLRGATTLDEVYRRPFVTVWTGLRDGRSFEDATRAGLHRAVAAAVLDVQLAQRAALQAAQDASSTTRTTQTQRGNRGDTGGGGREAQRGNTRTTQIYGFARAANPGACAFCRLVDGAYVKRADAMALHPHCRCSLVPLSGPHPGAARLPDGTPISQLTPQVDVPGVALHHHGEYGAVLSDPRHNFLSEASALAR